MKRLAIALAIVAMAAACKKAEEQPATESQMTTDTTTQMAPADTAPVMGGDTAKMAGDTTKM